MPILAHQFIHEDDSAPNKWFIVAHGIFGRGQNWRTIARKLCAQRVAAGKEPWGVVLVDLRGHGGSTEIAGPHSLAAAASDVVETARSLHQSHPIRGLLGHSFGGKVVLAASESIELELVWVIDASPSANPAGLSEPTRAAPRALGILESIESDHRSGFGERGEFIRLLEARGIENGVAQFLAMNLSRDSEQRLRLSISLADIRTMLEGYFGTDLWSVVRSADCPLHVAVAGRGSALSPSDQKLLEAEVLAGRNVVVHPFPDAGHWIHAEQPAKLIDAIDKSLS